MMVVIMLRSHPSLFDNPTLQEERSLERRKSAAKDAVSGHVPNMYEQILKE